MSVKSFQNNFWCSEEKHCLFLQISQMFLFYMWHNFDSFDRFMLLVNWLICILVIKNLSVWMLTSCTIKYQVFVTFFWFNGITFLNPTVVEFHHPLLDHGCLKLLYDQNFKIISYFDFQKWILKPLMPSQWRWR